MLKTFLQLFKEKEITPFEEFKEEVVDRFTDNFYDRNEHWIDEDNGFEEICKRLFGKCPIKSAYTIERLFRLKKW